MTQPSLFETDDDAPRLPAPLPAEPWLVEELVKLGVSRETAEGYTMPQAFAVRGKLARAGGAKKKFRELPPPLSEEFTRPPLKLPHPERKTAARLLAGWLAEWERGEMTEDELLRGVRGTLYVCSTAELVRVGKGLVALLEEVK